MLILLLHVQAIILDFVHLFITLFYVFMFRNLPPESKTAIVLQEELTLKDLSFKRQHEDFVKQM